VLSSAGAMVSKSLFEDMALLPLTRRTQWCARRDLFVVGLRLGHGVCRHLSGHTQLLTYAVFDFEGHFGMFFEVFAGIVFTLAYTCTAVAEPGARLVDYACLHAQVDDFALARDTGTVHDVEFGLLERRGHLVLDNLDARFVADDFVALLDGTDTADIE